MSGNTEVVQTLAQVQSMGFDFGKIAKIESPKEAITALLESLGNIFKCERVYVLEKNEEGNYDCTDEWVSENTIAKKHLLQNLTPKSVRYYYNHFLRSGRLCIRDMEEFKQEDYELYKILKPQNLKSLLCGQLVYDESDRGFVGIDNPDVEKFGELESIFGVINYYISIQKHRKDVMHKIADENEQATTEARRSLYDQAFGLKMEEPLAVIYGEVMLRDGDIRNETEVGKTLVSNTERVLINMFGSENVFSIGKNEFVMLYEGKDGNDISKIEDKIRTVQRTLEALRIRVPMGMVETDCYQNNIFELINKANSAMIKEKQEYRRRFVGKYHMQIPTLKFKDLIEIHPVEDYYTVLYSEYEGLKKKEGRMIELLEEMVHRVHPDERKRFREFWSRQVSEKLQTPSLKKEKETENFQVFRGNNLIANAEISVVTYIDTQGYPVLICYTE